MLTRPSHDALQRRNRQRPVSTGKRISLQQRDLLWFQKIHQHGPLSSSFLHAYSKQFCRSEKRAKDRLTDLFNEDNTFHGGRYLTRPWQQFETFDSRYQQLVHDLAPAGERVLKQHGKWHDHAASASGPWKHRYMVAAITASIELATLERADLAFIPGHRILERANAKSRHPVPFENPRTARFETRDLIPDAFFGLEYRTEQGPRYRFFAVEADRGTEPTRASRFNRKSHLRNFLQYREYVGRGIYKTHLDLTAGMMVLNVVTSEITLQAMLRLLDEISPKGNGYQLFYLVDGFGQLFRPGNPMTDLLSARWRRSNASRFRIDQA